MAVNNNQLTYVSTELLLKLDEKEGDRAELSSASDQQLTGAAAAKKKKEKTADWRKQNEDAHKETNLVSWSVSGGRIHIGSITTLIFSLSLIRQSDANFKQCILHIDMAWCSSLLLRVQTTGIPLSLHSSVVKQCIKSYTIVKFQILYKVGCIRPPWEAGGGLCNNLFLAPTFATSVHTFHSHYFLYLVLGQTNLFHN